MRAILNGAIAMLGLGGCVVPATVVVAGDAGDMIATDAVSDVIAPDAGDARDAIDVTLDARDMGPGCDAGLTLCGSACVDTMRDPANCGMCGHACTTADAGVIAMCSMGACSTHCAMGYYPNAGACAPIVAPQQIAPLSTSTVLGPKPKFHWQYPSGSGLTGATVTVWRTPDTTTAPVVQIALATGSPTSTDTGTTPLAPGVYYWSISGIVDQGASGRFLGTQQSALWEVRVRASSSVAAVGQSALATDLDVNRDGLSDLAVGSTTASASVCTADVYYGSRGTLPVAPSLHLPATALPGTYFGYSVASAGDIDGDGFGDLVVGATSSGLNGGVFVYRGSATGLVAASPTNLSGLNPEADFGHAVVGAGDLNGDGYGDLAVGEPDDNNTTTGAGHVYVFYGSSTGLPAAPSVTLTQPGMGAFGEVIAAGDMTGDGISDLAIGEPYYAPSSTNDGRVWIYVGQSGGGFSTPNILVPQSAGAAGFFGSSLVVDDFDGDGIADLIVGEPFGSTPGFYFFSGSLSGPSRTGFSRVANPGFDSDFGYASPAGDIDGDGFGDLWVTARSTGGNGALYLFKGSSSGPIAETGVGRTFPGDATGFRSPGVVGGGDVNGDGMFEVAVGFGDGNGSVLVYSAAAPLGTPIWMLNGPEGAASGYGMGALAL